VQNDICLTGGRISTGILTVQKLIQAQTEVEAIEKFKLELKVNEKYLSHENQTIQ
jgi:hypothetical protein